MTFVWNRPLGLPECPYIRLWMIEIGGFAIRVHKWSGSDDSRHTHDHPWWFWTLVLWGGYIDVSFDDPPRKANVAQYYADVLTMGSIRFRPSHHKHTVKLTHKPTWTLLLTGRPLRRWGFWVDGKLIKRDKYFAVHGHHPCDETGENAPVRMRPDGERI